MITKKYHFEQLKCHECGTEVIEELERISYIQNVYIDFDKGDITIESINDLTEEEVRKIVDNIVIVDHTTHKEYFKSLPDLITEEFNFDDIDCPNCALKVEKALNNNKKIIDAQVNFINKKIIIKHLNNVDIFNVASKILKSVESDARLYKSDEVKPEENKTKKIVEYTLLGIGFVLYIVSIILNKFTSINPIITIVGFWISYCLISYDIIFESINGFIHKDIFNENLLMIIASLGALLINEPIEGIMVILLFKIGEFFQDLATEKSKNSIKSLIELKNDTVTLKNGSTKNVKDVTVGEIITIHVGEQVPLDGVIKAGDTNIDMKTLTGESAPVFASIGEEILSGSINLTRVIDVEVTKKDSESTMTKVLKLVEDASSKKSKSEEFISKFAKIYTPIVLVIALVIGIVQGLIQKENITDVLNNIFTLLVISCPCALVISIPLGYFSGIGRSSSAGIMVKGGSYLEALSKAKTFVFDKTGTITKGNFKVSEIKPNGLHTKDEVLNIVANVEQYSMHPIATSIKEAYQKEVNILNGAKVEEIGGSGLKVNLKENNIDKEILVGNSKLMENYHINYEKNDRVGTILYLSVNNEFYGSIVINDEIKEEAFGLIKYLNENKIKSVMLTGDSDSVANEVSSKVGINEYHSKMLPEEKYKALNEIISNKNESVVYVGDGINDTPSLKLADIGIAMGGTGSDSAKECADIVIMNDNLSKITEGIKISKFTKKIILENIIFSLVIKISAIIIGINGILGSFAMIIALFADVGVCLLAILNVLRILRYKNK